MKLSKPAGLEEIVKFYNKYWTMDVSEESGEDSMKKKIRYEGGNDVFE